MKHPLIISALLAVLVAVPPGAKAVSSARAAGSPAPEQVVAAAPPIEVVEEIPPHVVPAPVKVEGPVDHTPRVGSKGPEILAIEQRLEALNYMVGKVDGTFDRATQHGVTAFQKVEGLPRNGKGDSRTLERLSSASTPQPKYATPADHLEVDIPRQVVFVVRGGRVTAILPTSTGSGKNFTSEGWTRRAITPNGQFKIGRKINGMRVSPLGELYKPSYFNGGIAFHGNGSVPTGPASHGCVRLPMQFADWFFAEAAPRGMVVYVYGGPTGENPQPYIDDRPAESPPPSQAPPPSPSPSPSPRPVIPEPSPSSGSTNTAN